MESVTNEISVENSHDKIEFNYENFKKILQKNTALESENTSLKEELTDIKSQLEWLKKQVFGSKTEKVLDATDCSGQLSFLSDDERECQEDYSEEITVAEHKKRKKTRTHDDWMSRLEIKEKRHEVKNKFCEKCGAQLEEMGEDNAYDELVYIPEKFFIRRHIVKTMKCPVCGKDENKDKLGDDIEKQNIVRAEYPKPMIPGSFCSPELLAHIAYEKYAKAVPLYRQAKDFSAKGAEILVATMSNWILTVFENRCKPVVEEMTKRLLSEDIIHADETPFQVLHEEGRKATTKSEMWVYCNKKNEGKNIIIFDYKPTRKGANARDFLKDFIGYLICDGYPGYNLVENVKRCGCLTHFRRYFFKAMPEDKSLYSTSAAYKVVNFVDRIYHEENKLKDCTAEERYAGRQAKIKPLLDEMFAYIESITASSAALKKAVVYANNEKKYLYTFLENPEVPPDNNRAENAIRPFTLGRKNWLFSNSEKGAKASAAFYSIITTAQANGLNAEKYLTKLFSSPAGTIILPWKEGEDEKENV